MNFRPFAIRISVNGAQAFRTRRPFFKTVFTNLK